MKEEYQIYKEKIADAEREFSSCFCLAKWFHSNIYFQTGETHSCYHPAPHAINVKDVKINPAALHNTQEKMSERKMMLNNSRPKGCQYCWNIEDLNKDLISDRHIRTGSMYSPERVQEVKQDPIGQKVVPDYIEISFSNLCNFKCGYCHPKASSRYYQEIQQFGPYTMSNNHRCDIDWLKIYEEENNPFIEAWWNWWPELSQKLKILRLTGGEPLIQKSTNRLISFMKEFPNPKLEFNVNSNLGSAPTIVDKFCLEINEIIEQNRIQKFKMFTSIDSWGKQAEYVRTGLNLELFERNLKSYLTLTNQPLTLMITFNIFSIPNFHLLLEKILSWRLEFSNNGQDFQDFHRIRFDISYLKEPLQFDINILPKEEFLQYMDSHLAFFKNNVDDNRKDKFSFMEYQRFLRIYEYMKNTVYDSKKVHQGRVDFYNYFQEYDKRRNLDLQKTFPEFNTFWQLCKTSSED